MYLQLMGLSKSYNNTMAVEDLHLELEKGELLSILGPSGCGKTTTLRMVGGFIPADSGKVILEGRDISLIPPNLRPTATVFQSYALFPHMNVIQNVCYGLKFQKRGKKEMLAQGEEMLEMVGLKHYRNKPVNQLSGGEQQRVALARAMVMNPKVLLLDEPLSNLDAKLRQKMRKEIRDIQKELGITTVYVTHDQEEALSISDHIAVMNHGRLEQVGTPKTVYDSPASRFVAEFIGRINFLAGKGEQISAVRPERITLSEVSGSLPGIIAQKQFTGAYTTYFVRVNDRTVEVDVPSLADREWNPDDAVYLSY
jgi:iron(III) transport system ATP-binding protein